MSTDTVPDDGFESLKIGVLCYLHLWAALHKHVSVPHGDIGRDIGLWDDRSGGYFAAYTPGNARMLQVNGSYVCAAGEEGPMVGQLDKAPPCDPVLIPPDAVVLLKGLAVSGGSGTDKTLAQIAMIATMIDSGLAKSGKKARKIVN